MLHSHNIVISQISLSSVKECNIESNKIIATYRATLKKQMFTDIFQCIFFVLHSKFEGQTHATLKATSRETKSRCCTVLKLCCPLLKLCWIRSGGHFKNVASGKHSLKSMLHLSNKVKKHNVASMFLCCCALVSFRHRIA